MKKMLQAIGFLTIIPLGTKKNLSSNDFRSIARWFYIVGFILPVPFIFFYHYVLVNTFFGINFIPSILAVGYMAIVTGGLHLDGLADTVDGLFGGKTPEQRLQIMRKSDVGSFGIIAIVLILLFKFAVFASVYNIHFIIIMLPLSAMIGRWAMVFAAGISRYARENGTGEGFVNAISYQQAIPLTLPPLIITVLLTYYAGLIIFGVVAVFVLISVYYCKEKIGGLTGDTLGAICEVSEALTLLIFMGLANTELFTSSYKLYLKESLEYVFA